MFSKRKFLLISKINVLFLILLILIKFLPVTFSRYQSSGIGNVNSNIAFYLLDVGQMNKTIKISDLIPSDSGYVYHFTISNVKDNRVSDVDLEYILKIRTTTNLPIRYELFLNSDYQDGNSVNLINNDNTKIEKDLDGTYFQEFTFDKVELFYKTPKVNTYTLVVYLDKNEEDFVYQGAVELIELSVDSSQVTVN